MRKITVFSVLFVFVFVFISNAAEYPSSEYVKFYEINTAPLIPGGVDSIESVKYFLTQEEFASTRAQAVPLAFGFNKSAIDAFFSQINQFKIRKGTVWKMIRMTYQSKYGLIKAVPTKLKWGGKESLPCFMWDVVDKKQNKIYTCGMIKPCGNFCLLEVKDLPLKKVTIESKEEPKKPIVRVRPKPEPLEQRQIEVPEPEKALQKIMSIMGFGIKGVKRCFMFYYVAEAGMGFMLDENGATYLEVIGEANLPIKIGTSKRGRSFLGARLQLRQQIVKGFSFAIGGAYSGKAVDYQEDFWEGLVSIMVGGIYAEARIPCKYLKDIGNISVKSHVGPPWEFQIGFRLGL